MERSVCPTACFMSETAKRISIKFDIWGGGVSTLKVTTSIQLYIKLMYNFVAFLKNGSSHKKLVHDVMSLICTRFI